MHHLLYSNLYRGTKPENYIDWYVLCYPLAALQFWLQFWLASLVEIQTAVHIEIIIIIADICETGVLLSHKPKQLTLGG